MEGGVGRRAGLAGCGKCPPTGIQSPDRSARSENTQTHTHTHTHTHVFFFLCFVNENRMFLTSFLMKKLLIAESDALATRVFRRAPWLSDF